MAPPLEANQQVRCIADVRANVGEGPVWVERETALYWVDNKGRKVFHLREEGVVRTFETPFEICCIAPKRSGGFIAGTDRGLADVDFETGRFDVFANPEEEIPDNRFNDGKTDWSGRFWSGTMDNREKEATGSLYRIDADQSWARIDGGYRVTNGPAFDRARRRMYHTDSALQVIYRFDLSDDGEVGERSDFIRFGEGDGFPDGMTVDVDGNLWVAFWDGWCLRRISPDGQVLERIEMPVQRPTSCAFGGPNLDRLYVTSARRGLDEGALKMQPCAGGLFLVLTNARGIAEAEFGG
jgi:sugar lactone lactonase YvrE